MCKWTFVQFFIFYFRTCKYLKCKTHSPTVDKKIEYRWSLYSNNDKGVEAKLSHGFNSDFARNMSELKQLNNV